MDNMVNLAYALGLVVGIIVAAAIVIVMSKKPGKDGKPRWAYDERQRADRNASFATGFLVLVVLELLTAGLRQSGMALPFDALTEALICCLTAAAVSVILCIHREAWLSLKENPKGITRLLLLLMACNGMGAWANWSEMYADGVLNIRSMNLLVMIFMAVILVAFGIKRLCVYLAEIHDGLAEKDV